MANRGIAITTSRNDQATAAAKLSDVLEALGCPHAYIGGFAWALLGNVLIEVKNIDIQVLRQQLKELNKQFASAGFKLYFVTEPLGNQTGDEVVRTSKNNVMIETLVAGELGLPKVAGPIHEVTHELGKSIKILHPGVLILTKMKRWFINLESTRPKTVTKTNSDRRDLDYITLWLQENNMTIEFEEYQGKTKEELLVFVRKYREVLAGNTEMEEALKAVIKPMDWDLL
ncbi:hypothetical protein CVT24_002050 [Panaeolus cyanescens]|uniref:Uncharacterized protein n=1 Tax=Panaeolus cyanescens TaxID=181874 RepID=A0A409YHL0_9AGAR|nr:hypothetical protein CVT24_002050 [Panaeolus cyanescens]